MVDQLLAKLQLLDVPGLHSALTKIVKLCRTPRFEIRKVDFCVVEGFGFC
jgi:hypothetical protein